MPHRFAAVAADIRDIAAAERKRRADRTDELLMYALDTDAGPHTQAAVAAIAAIPQVFASDVVVLLQALTSALQRHHMHIEDRCHLVDELQCLALVTQERIDDAAAEADDDESDADAWLGARREVAA